MDHVIKEGHVVGSLKFWSICNCPVRDCRVFSRVSGLYLLDASSNFLQVQSSEMSSGVAAVLREAESPQLRTTALESGSRPCVETLRDQMRVGEEGAREHLSDVRRLEWTISEEELFQMMALSRTVQWPYLCFRFCKQSTVKDQCASLRENSSSRGPTQSFPLSGLVTTVV